MQTFSTRWATSVLCGIVLLFVTLIGRVAYLESYGRQQTIARADHEHYQSLVLRARPGDIFDRNGLVLAGTVQTQTLFIDPKFMQEVYQQDGHSLVELDDAVQKLAGILDKDAFEISQLLADRSTSRFVKVADNLNDTQCQAITRLNLPGSGLQPSNVRYYPMGSLAAHILGGASRDGHGLDGLELQYEKLLMGHDGWERPLKDARHRPVSVAAEDYQPPQHGQQLVLTIDANIQMIAEQELADACTKYKAKRGEVVVLDPATGEVLALADWPTFNPQNLTDSSADVRRDRALTDPFECGSVIKPFIVGPALQWHVTRLNEVWPVPGIRYRTPYGRTITDVHGYGPLSMWDGLVKSSNIVMSMLGERLGNTQLHRALAGFGFGRPTGIELPGESGGRLNPLRKWTKYSTESVSQGYELMTTPLQLTRAFCAYANGGHLVRPSILRGVLQADGSVISKVRHPDLSETPLVVEPMTALALRRVLCDVVVRGTATGARSATWNIYGKTGTAHISEGRSGYSLTRFNSSFLCAAPAENPRLVVGMFIHEPDRALAHYGGTVSGPASKNIMERSLTYLSVPSSPELQPPPPQIASVLVNYNPKVYKVHRAAETADARE